MMKKIFVFLLVFLLLVVGALSYIGVVPFISPLIAKAKDLGIKTDRELVNKFDEKYGMKNELPGGVVEEGREPSYEGSVELDISLSGEEISSILEYWKSQYGMTPIRDVQVRINKDGTGEVSGILEISTAVMMAKNLGYSNSDIEKAKGYAKYVAGDLPFYIKGKGGVDNNKVSVMASEIQIGRVSLPESIKEAVAKASGDMVERRMRQVPGVNIEKLSLEDGKVNLKGSIPNTVK